MAVNRDPILKRCRSLQIDPSHLGIFKESKRNTQRNNRKMSEYGLQLREKQRAKFIYGILEKQYSAGNFDKDITCTLSLIIEKPNEPKSAHQFKLFRRDTKDQTTLVQLAPEADKGTAYMQEKNILPHINLLTRRLSVQLEIPTQAFRM